MHVLPRIAFWGGPANGTRSPLAAVCHTWHAALQNTGKPFKKAAVTVMTTLLRRELTRIFIPFWLIQQEKNTHIFSEETYMLALVKNASLFDFFGSNQNQKWTDRQTFLQLFECQSIRASMTVDINQKQTGLIQHSNSGSPAEVN